MSIKSRLDRLEQQAQPQRTAPRLTLAEVLAMAKHAGNVQGMREWLTANITDRDAAQMYAGTLSRERAAEIEYLIDTTAPAELRTVLDQIAEAIR